MDAAGCLSAALGLVSEPAAAVKNGIIEYMNSAASALAGGDLTGAPADRLLPPQILYTQAESFVTGGVICGRSCVVRAASVDGLRVYVIEPDRDRGRDHGMLLSAMRSNLGNIKLAADRIALLCEDSQREKLAAYEAALYRSYYRLKRLVVNVSAADGIFRGTLPFSPAVLDLSRLCQDIAADVRTFAAGSGVELIFETSGGCVCYGDGELLELMLLNLLSNSLLHTPPGGRIRLSLSESMGFAVITVADNGEGITPEILGTVFSRFASDIPLSDAGGGAGLGLTIARGAAEKHGGALILESRPGEGTIVRATVSKGCPPSGKLRAAEAEYSSGGMDEVLTQLSTWLSDTTDINKYLD